MTTSPRADRGLRAGLSAALVVLLLAGLVVGPTRHPVRAVQVAPAATSKDSQPTLRAPADGVPPPPPRVQVSPDCGLSLTPGASAGPVGHCRILEIGDSLGNDLGWGLARQLPPGSGFDLVQLDKSASGLANPSFYNWPGALAADLSEYHPQLVLVSLGGNDEQGMDVNGSAAQFPTPAWQAAYLARVRQLIGEATSDGAYVMWVGLPIMQQPSYRAGVQILDSLYERAILAVPGATFVSTWSLFADPAGTYQLGASVDGRPEMLRQPDGIHYSFAGEDVIATFVISQIAAIYHVQVAAGNPAAITGWT